MNDDVTDDKDQQDQNGDQDGQFHELLDHRKEQENNKDHNTDLDRCCHADEHVEWVNHF